MASKRTRKPTSTNSAKALAQSSAAASLTTTGEHIDYRFADIPENRPIFADSQSYRQADLPDDRPIYAAQPHQEGLDVVAWSTAPGSRPVATSDIQALDGVRLPYNSRLFQSEMKDWPTFYLSGDRPVAPSNLAVTEHPSLPNSRPIGANGNDNSPDLMGFID